MTVFYFNTCSHFPYLRIMSYTTRVSSTSPIYVLCPSVKGRMRGVFMFPVSVTQVSVTCSWTGQSDEAAEGRLWRCRFICRNQAVTPRLIWLVEGCERGLTHADLGLLSFMAQVSIHLLCNRLRRSAKCGWLKTSSCTNTWWKKFLASGVNHWSISLISMIT